MLWLYLITLLAILLLLAWIRYHIVMTCGPRTNPTPSMMIVLGSGGHTGEMFRLLKDVQLDQYSHRYWVYTTGDALSAEKAVAYEKNYNSNSKKSTKGDIHHNWTLLESPRARHVGQSYFSSIFSSLVSFSKSFLHVFNTRPSVLICNGPGTCLIIGISAFLLNFIGLSHTRVIYVESLARVQSLSLSGKLIRPITHRFIVQWPSLARKHPGSEYYGILV